MFNHSTYRVLLPDRINKEAQDEEHLKMLALDYMKRYPHYAMTGVEDGFILCEKTGGKNS